MSKPRFLLGTLEYRTPLYGGMAFGLDRVLMILGGARRHRLPQDATGAGSHDQGPLAREPHPLMGTSN